MLKLTKTFSELMTMMTSTGRAGQKRLSLNTYAILNKTTGCIEIRYYSHPIITIKPNNSFTVSNHGWPISDVRELINAYTNLNITLKRGVWYYEGNLPFYNDMEITPKKEVQANA